MAKPDDELRTLFGERADAMGANDIERVMALYAPDVVYFDLVPPLHYTGTDALRERFLDWFSRWQGPIGQQLHELEVRAENRLATAHMLVRAHGTRQDGTAVDYFVRVTNSCARSDGGWRITHEHVSLPVDMSTGTARMDLTPDA